MPKEAGAKTVPMSERVTKDPKDMRDPGEYAKGLELAKDGKGLDAAGKEVILPTAHQSSEASMGPAPHLPLNVPSTATPPPEEEIPPELAAKPGEEEHGEHGEEGHGGETPAQREARAKREREEALKHQHGG